MMTYVGDYKNHYCELYDHEGNMIYHINCGGNITPSFYGYPYRLFGSATSGGGRGNLDCHSKLAAARLYMNDELICHVLPIIRNGENEMVDIVTGTICSRVGTFTIGYGNMQNGVWTPWTPEY